MKNNHFHRKFVKLTTFLVYVPKMISQKFVKMNIEYNAWKKSLVFPQIDEKYRYFVEKQENCLICVFTKKNSYLFHQFYHSEIYRRTTEAKTSAWLSIAVGHVPHINKSGQE